MSRAGAIRISAHYPILVIKSEQDGGSGTRRIDREVQRATGIPVVTVKDYSIYIVSYRQLF